MHKQSRLVLIGRMDSLAKSQRKPQMVLVSGGNLATGSERKIREYIHSRMGSNWNCHSIEVTPATARVEYVGFNKRPVVAGSRRRFRR